MRANADDALTVSVIMGVQTTVVQVRWAWISLPLLITLGGAAFLLLTVLSTANSKAPLWKEEGLATVMHGFLSEVDTETAAKLGNVAAMEKYAEKTRVHLRHAASGKIGLVATSMMKSKENNCKVQLLNACDTSRGARRK